MKFEIGDIVKCIKVDGEDNTYMYPPLILGREYIVYGIRACSKCGEIDLDVGLITPYENSTEFCACDVEICIPAGVAWWCDANRFVKRVSVKERIADAVEIEDYELAQELHENSNV